MLTLKKIIDIFSKGKSPKGTEFEETWKSFWHKSEKLPIEQIVGLAEEISKATTNFKGYHTDDVALKKAYPKAENKKDFFAWVGSKPTFVWKVYTNGTDWQNTGDEPTEQEINLEAYATKVEVDKNLYENILSDINTMRTSKINAEGLNGATINQDKTKITIPIGSTGKDSYFLSVFEDKELLNVFKDSYISNNNSIWAVLKFKASDSYLASFLTPRLQADSNNKIGTHTAWIADDDYMYLLFQVSADLSNLSSSLRVGVQFYPKSALDKEFTFEYIDSTFFIRDNSIYSSLLAEKVNESRYTSSYTFGSSLISYSRFGKFVGGIVCNNTPATIKGTLKSIYIRVNGSGGMLRFGIGIIDQRNWAIIRDQFTLDVVSGNQTIDTSSLNIVVDKDEVIFVYLDDEEAAPMFQQGTKEEHDLMLYNDQTADGALFRLATTYGGYITLSWTIDSVSSNLYATKQDVNKIDKDLKSANEAIIETNSKLGTAIDYVGNRYDLRVVNGVVVPIAMKYIKALVIGNSITWHPILANTWWGEWGMAATKKEFDLVSILEKGLRIVDNTAVATGFNIALWERNYDIDKDMLFNGVLTADIDFIAFRLGENVVDTANFERAFDELVSYTISKCPRAKFVITGVFWANPAKDTAMMNVATKYGMTFIKLADLDTSDNKEKVGNVVWGNDGKQHTITSSGVANHPNDLGMKRIGNRLLTAVGYKVMD